MQQTTRLSIKKILMVFTVIISLAALYAKESVEVKPQKKAKIKTEQSEIKLKGLVIKLKEKEVHMDAQICLEDGLLEFLMCLPNTFEHESLFVTKTKPELLHTALLLIGMEPYRGFGGLASLWLDKTGKKAKASLNIEVELTDGTEKTRVKLVEFLTYRQDDGYDAMGMQKKIENDEDPDRPVTDSWVFTGSFFHETKEKKKIYAANIGGVVMAIMPQSAAVIQFGEESLNPYQGDGNGLEISGEHGITAGTNVTIIFSKLKSEENETMAVEKKGSKTDKGISTKKTVEKKKK
jgi:hypothetical protein